MQCRKVTTYFLSAVLAAYACSMTVPFACAHEIDEAKALKVKSAYLYNFAKFIEWPDRAFEDGNAPFVIGVLNDEPFADVLTATVKDKRVAGRRVEVRRFRWSRRADRTRLRDCHALYIGESRQADLADILALLVPHAVGEPVLPVLAVSDIDSFARKGGMIGFVLEEGRIVFEINIDAFERAELKASSKLLKLAKIVEQITDRRELRSSRKP